MQGQFFKDNNQAKFAYERQNLSNHDKLEKILNFLKNVTVLDDLAAVTRMTGGLNVGGNQTFPGPFWKLDGLRYRRVWAQ